MKLGIVVDQFRANAGGSHRFQAEIVGAILSIAKGQPIAILSSSGEVLARHPRLPTAPTEASGIIRSRGPGTDIIGRVWRRTLGRSNPAIDPHVSIEARAVGLRRVAENEQVDLLWFLSPGLYGFFGIPTAVTVWDLAHRKYPFFPEVSSSGWTWDDRENHYRYCLPRASFVIAGTAVGKAEIERFYGVDPDCIRIIPFPTPEIRASSPSNRSGCPSEPYLLYPAQFWPHKNHIAVVETLRSLRDDLGRNLSVVFTGEDKGNLAYVTEVTKELGLTERVHMLGFVPDDQLANLYENATALLYPTYFGPDNLPPLEAFAHGCPVIAFDTAGSREQLGEAALLVDPAEAGAMARAVCMVMDNDEVRESLIEKGRIRAAAWTAFDYANRILEVTEEFARFRKCWSPRDPYTHT